MNRRATRLGGENQTLDVCGAATSTASGALARIVTAHCNAARVQSADTWDRVEADVTLPR